MICIPLLASLATAIPREDVLDNAARYATHPWTSTGDNQEASCTEGDYESDYPPGAYVGLPYDWGGYVTLAEFDDQIDNGYGAGSHSWHGILSCTTGVDCSGFVSMIWETDHYSTSSFPSGPTSPIDWSDLERGDALNDPGSHMVVYTHETDAGWPVFYEGVGSASKVRLNSTSGWSYVDGFDGLRFDGIEDGPVSGTEGAPRDIAAFPYTDFRWTAGAASDRIDNYACAPSTDESGPEVLYRFQAATEGTLEVVVSDAVGVDVDIHVLTSPNGEDCVARDDQELAVEIGPGEVWIIADTFVGASEFPGPYLLTATFDGEIGELDPTDPGEDSGTGAEDTAPTDTDAESGDTGEAPSDVDRTHDEPRRLERPRTREACGCAMVAAPGGLPLLGVVLLASRRRHRINA